MGLNIFTLANRQKQSARHLVFAIADFGMSQL